MGIDVAGLLVCVLIVFGAGGLIYGALRLLRFLPAMGKHWHRCHCGSRWQHGNPWCAVGLDYPCGVCSLKVRP
jgi:hypothetical protein